MLPTIHRPAMALTGPEESLREHNKIVGNVLKYMELTSDKSGLTLDPDMDSFYLKDGAIFRMQHVIDYAGRLRARGSSVLQRQVKSSAEDTRLSVLGDRGRRETARS
jgi:methyl-accepting chemotaxis protein